MIVNKIRQHFPRPSVSPSLDRPDDGYCVGGALCCYEQGILAFRHAPVSVRYPSPTAVASAIQHLDPDVPSKTAHHHALLIVAHNDANNPEAAWQELRQALEKESAPTSQT